MVENAPLYGMKIGWGPYMRNVVATGNVIRKAGTGIAVTVVEGAGSAVISDNVIADVEGRRDRRLSLGGRRHRRHGGRAANGGYAHLTVERNHVS